MAGGPPTFVYGGTDVPGGEVPILGIAPAMANTWFSATRERSSALPLQLALTRGKLQPG